ncbi:hypothetical protein [Kistimonas scapharcae]|uniref:hypothetical protein n=1 Tax=Kistimonas scapharcae TaxID=1036133 RepID=UPI0031E7B846
MVISPLLMTKDITLWSMEERHATGVTGCTVVGLPRSCGLHGALFPTIITRRATINAGHLAIGQ